MFWELCKQYLRCFCCCCCCGRCEHKWNNGHVETSLSAIFSCVRRILFLLSARLTKGRLRSIGGIQNPIFLIYFRLRESCGVFSLTKRSSIESEALLMMSSIKALEMNRLPCRWKIRTFQNFQTAQVKLRGIKQNVWK